jgi:hypothetical protein
MHATNKCMDKYYMQDLDADGNIIIIINHDEKYLEYVYRIRLG